MSEYCCTFVNNYLQTSTSDRGLGALSQLIEGQDCQVLYIR